MKKNKNIVAFNTRSEVFEYIDKTNIPEFELYHWAKWILIY